ncbi:MAG: sulfatase-like hydrolase/transferase, partial [Myxococcota bacterium]
KPFFLYVPFTAPHSPMQAPEETVKRYEHLPQKNYRRTYAAMVHEMDLAVGSILDALERQGLADDTLVLFFSDNGGANIFGGVNTPLRGQKGETFEGGIRVPAVLRWPGHLAAGSQFPRLVSVMDVFPTLAAAAGIPIEPNPPLDGIDMWPAIALDKLAPHRDPIFFASEIPIPGILQLAVIEWQWKLVQIIREGQTETTVKTFLFDLGDDPFERKDLSQERPEIVAHMAKKIRAWRSQHPMAGLRGTLVAHPGWVAPHDWAEAVTASRLLQPSWQNELPFSKALIDATAERGVLVDEATRKQLEELEKASRSGWSPPED